MFFSDNSFKVLESGITASWLQQQLHMQNLANIETPGYKAKSLQFDEVLDEAKEGDIDAGGKVLRAKVVSSENTSTRPDGNNVDVDAEGVEMYKAYAQYTMLLDKVSGQFTNYNYVLNNAMK